MKYHLWGHTGVFLIVMFVVLCMQYMPVLYLLIAKYQIGIYYYLIDLESNANIFIIASREMYTYIGNYCY